MKLYQKIALTVGVVVSVAVIVAAVIIVWEIRQYQNTRTRQPVGEQQAEVSQEAARQKVLALPEVREFQQTLAKAGKQARVDVEDQGQAWAVHVYEIVTTTTDSHTATFAWYWVDKTTGRISSGFE